MKPRNSITTLFIAVVMLAFLILLGCASPPKENHSTLDLDRWSTEAIEGYAKALNDLNH